MDSLTHIVLGACLGEVIAGKKLGKKAMLIGAVANSLPDIDVISRLWTDIPESMLAHRGFTHSFLFVVLCTPLLSWLMVKYARRWQCSFGTWCLLIGSGLFVHNFIDAFTSYGTGWYEPFSHERVSFNTIFVADPLYTIALLVAAITLLILKSASRRRTTWAWSGILISTAYLGYTIVNKVKVDSVATRSFANNRLAVQDYFTTPTPLNNFLWYIVEKDTAGYYIGYYSLFDKADAATLHFLPFGASLPDELLSRKDVQHLIRFSEGYYLTEEKDGSYIFNDMRFGQIGGWAKPDAPFVFSYILNSDTNSDALIQQGRWRASSGEAFRTMVERIKGK